MYRKILVILLLISLSFGVYPYEEEYNTSEEFAKGRIIEIHEEQLDQEISAGIIENYQRVLVEITSGEYKGKNVMIDNNFIDSPGYELYVREGDRVLLTVLSNAEGFQEAYIVDFVRDRYIYLLGGIFCILMLAIGRTSGVKSLLSLIITFAVIYKIMIPQIFAGRSPVMVAVVSATIISLITYLIVSGFSRKALSAFLGTGIGLVFAALLALFISNAANLTGFSTEESRMLFYVPEFADANMQGILLGGIIIGALGAIMDVCMSIASSIEEIAGAGEKMSFAGLFRSGMNVGNDIMGTMTNTLVLAYTGASLPLLLLLLAYDLPLLHLINFEMLADEIIRALIGTIALVIAIPITAAISAFLLKGK